MRQRPLRRARLWGAVLADQSGLLEDRLLRQGAKVLQPFRQGHASSLCGLYALLNAIRLVLWPHHKLTPSQLKKRFISAVQHLEQSRGLAPILGSGIDEDAWLELSWALIKQASALTGTSICRRFILRRRSSLTGRSAVASIKQQLRCNRPVLVILSGPYDHVTVMVGYNRGRLILFDSSGFKWINEEGAGLHHPSSQKRHQITRRTVVALSLEEAW